MPYNPSTLYDPRNFTEVEEEVLELYNIEMQDRGFDTLTIEQFRNSNIYFAFFMLAQFVEREDLLRANMAFAIESYLQQVDTKRTDLLNNGVLGLENRLLNIEYVNSVGIYTPNTAGLNIDAGKIQISIYAPSLSTPIDGVELLELGTAVSEGVAAGIITEQIAGVPANNVCNFQLTTEAGNFDFVFTIAEEADLFVELNITREFTYGGIYLTDDEIKDIYLSLFNKKYVFGNDLIAKKMLCLDAYQGVSSIESVFTLNSVVYPQNITLTQIGLNKSLRLIKNNITVNIL